MKLSNKLELKVENIDKCHLVTDVDCPIGQLYDFTCAMQTFLIENMKDHTDKQQVKVENE